VSLPVYFRPAAEADIRETHEAYELIRPGLGNRFVDRLREVLERIEFMPEMYGIVWQDVRAVRLKRFRHVVYYVVLGGRVEVLAVMHGARDASAWQSRIERE
jgi:plasmid stabilization system protein ParE